MSDDAFFTVDGDRYIPNRVCRGPWDPNSLHGRVIAGLLGAEMERLHGEPGLQFARMTVDLWRLPTFVPIEVRTEVAREGARIRVVDAEAFAGGVSVGRASGVLLRRGEEPEGEVWRPEPWDMPPPEAIKPEEFPAQAAGDWKPMWETRSLGRAFGSVGRKRVWLREVRPLVAGRELTPFQRVALACDFASPLANSGSHGLAYINVDITVYLYRLPRTEWVGFDVADHGSAEGVCVGECRLYDEAGPIGSSTVAGLAQRRRGR
ncbi:MAG: hypothetical protein AMXMBFR80_06250 [Dehalococcoidia bacterium]|jgi:acyl-CoA thioesterase